MSNGILFIASGKEKINEAIKSAESIRNYNELSISLITNRKVESRSIDNVIKLQETEDILSDKVFNIHRSPYDRTLYLDTDTLVKGSIYDIFSILNNFDIAVTHAPIREYKPYSKSYPFEDLPMTFPEFNGGVIAFRDCNKIYEFFESFRETYCNYVTDGYWRDQPAFRKSLYESDVRLTVMPREFNCRFHIGGYLADKAKIFHGRHINRTEICEKINSEICPRVYIQHGRDIDIYHQQNKTVFQEILDYILLNQWKVDLTRLYNKIQTDGIYTGVVAAIQNIRNKIN